MAYLAHLIARFGWRVYAKLMSKSEEFIDVKQLMAESSVEQLNQLAEEYFARTQDWNFHLSKPFGSIEEAPQLLINLAVVLQGLELCRGHRVLEFGAGTCWASRYLTQLGCSVIAMDISPTALAVGKELYERQPVFGNVPPPHFLLFDGFHIDLADESVDRIMCLHALHHVPNPETILSEFGRVLKKGGIAGFAEPGPEHSLSPQSQDEMRTFGVVENDVDVSKIWKDAQAAGFTDIKLAVFNVPPFLVSPGEFDQLLKGGGAAKQFTQSTAAFLRDQRTFFLYKGKRTVLDSRFPGGLSARIEIEPASIVAKAGEQITLQAIVENTGRAVWLPRGSGLGAVQLGVHVLDDNGKILHQSYHWEALMEGDGVPVQPGQTVKVDVSMPALPIGEYILEFDMVSNDVAWFAQNQSRTVRVRLSVV